MNSNESWKRDKLIMPHSISILQVINFAKSLCSYVMTITQKAPKQFRFLWLDSCRDICWILWRSFITPMISL